MTVETYAQLEGLWIKAGGNKGMAPVMAAIGEVESGGRTDALNPSGATGIWQLEWPLYANIVPGATSQAALEDPLTNARAAVKLSQNNPSVSPGSPVYDNWIEWETPLNPPAYLSQMKGGVNPSDPAGGGGSAPNPGITTTSVLSNLNPLTWITDALGGVDFADLLERGALIILGAVLIFIGIIRMMDDKPSTSGPALLGKAKASHDDATSTEKETVSEGVESSA